MGGQPASKEEALMRLARVRDVVARFVIPADFVSAAPYGSGHINDTYAVTMSQGGTPMRYLLQRINKRIFARPDLLMENILRVTEAAGRKAARFADASRRNLTVIPARNGLPYVMDADGEYWRAYVFVEQACSYDEVQTVEQAYQAARAFGQFQQWVADLGVPRLHEVIPGFHDTPKRIEALGQAMADDPFGRVAKCGRELEFALSRRDDAGLLINMLRAGTLPERITHNDTKINNVLFDQRSPEGICVIDLDTVMPGLVHYDFGDMVRTATSTAAEDEVDLSKVSVRLDLFEALLRGYLESARSFLTAEEKAMLPFSGKLITLEIGTRFLTDYLRGDVYFKTHRPGHNLDRCRNQFQRVKSIEDQYDQMLGILDKQRYSKPG
jgi:hypothetical protein